MVGFFVRGLICIEKAHVSQDKVMVFGGDLDEICVLGKPGRQEKLFTTKKYLNDLEHTDYHCIIRPIITVLVRCVGVPTVTCKRS